MSIFHIDCELNYDVWQQSVFILDILVPNAPDQRVIVESLTTAPALFAEQLNDPVSMNRRLRIDAPAGSIDAQQRMAAF